MSDKDNKKKAPSIWMPIILVTAIASSVNLYVFSTMSSDKAQDENTAHMLINDPYFLVVEPFTVNIVSEGHRSRLLYSGITLSTPDAASLDILQKHLPQVKNKLISVMSSSHADDLVTVEGKNKLSERILEALKDPSLIPQRGLVISEVLFTDFVVQ